MIAATANGLAHQPLIAKERLFQRYRLGP